MGGMEATESEDTDCHLRYWETVAGRNEADPQQRQNQGVRAGEGTDNLTISFVFPDPIVPLVFQLI